jgi:hypothetical protein
MKALALNVCHGSCFPRRLICPHRGTVSSIGRLFGGISAALLKRQRLVGRIG